MYMKLLFELSKEHKTLPTAEIFSCLQAENTRYSVIDVNEDVMIIETTVKNVAMKRLAERVSMTFFIEELLFHCPPLLREIKKQAEQHPIKPGGSLAIHYKNRSHSIDSQPVIQTLGKVYTQDRTVNLTNPDISIRVLITPSQVYVGLVRAAIDRTQFETRKVQHRPFFSPISLHPKLARALVNLSLIRKDETLLDPFCGTGGMLLEAGFIGAKVVGSDIEEKMIAGCTQTLYFYQIKSYNLFCSDVSEIKEYVGDVDAVVTDLPYGKSTTTKGEDLMQLYDRAFQSIFSVLKKSGRAVVGVANRDMLTCGKKYFSLLQAHEYRVHRSLTRFFGVYEK
jgi:tRNA (guanine10-N2)-dimethyltransferase